MEYTINMADMCELAHALTVRDCNRDRITIDVIEDNGDTRYTEEAQDIFNNYLAIVEENLIGEDKQEPIQEKDIIRNDDGDEIEQ